MNALSYAKIAAEQHSPVTSAEKHLKNMVLQVDIFPL